MKSQRRQCKIPFFLFIVFCILSIHQLSAQVKIKERVEINPQNTSIISNTWLQMDSSLNVTIQAQLQYKDWAPGRITAVDPKPVAQACPLDGQIIEDRFLLLGGNYDAAVGIEVEWGHFDGCGYCRVSNVRLLDGSHGTGYAPGDYSTWDCDGYGESDLIVRVVSVAEATDGCVTMKPERDTICYGDTVKLIIQGNYNWDQLFDVSLWGDGTLMANGGEQNTNFHGMMQPFYYIAPAQPSYYIGPICGSIRSGTERFSKPANKPIKLRDKLRTSLLMALNRLGLSDEKKNKIQDILKKLDALDEPATTCSLCKLAVRPGPPRTISLDWSPSDQVTMGQDVTLKAILTDKNEMEIDENNTSYGINFFLGDEGANYGKLIGGSQSGSSLTGIPYNVAHNGSVVFKLNAGEYNGIFPLRISIGVTYGNLEEATGIVSLVGPRTIGKYFNQGKGIWAPDYYDHSQWTVSDRGCAMTCIAMVLTAYGINTDPGMLNAWMMDGEYTKNAGVMWNSIHNYPSSLIECGTSIGKGLQYDENDKIDLDDSNPTDISTLDPILSQDQCAIVQVYDAENNRSHFVLITGKTSSDDYSILDPGCSDCTVLKKCYGNIYKIIPIKIK